MAKKGPEAVKVKGNRIEAKNKNEMKAIENKLRKDGYEFGGYWMMRREADELSFQAGLNEMKKNFYMVTVVNCKSAKERTLLVKDSKEDVGPSNGIEDIQDEIRAQF